MAELVVDSLSLRAGGKFIVRDVGFTVPSGECTALIGESGAGKTSLAVAIMGLWPGSLSGDIRLDGRSLSALSKREYRELRGRDLVLMLQDPMKALNPALTAGTQLHELLHRRRGLMRREARVEALAWLDRVGLRPASMAARLYPYQLSGGMAQRVLIAMALACRPKLLIADEPFSALDPITAAEHVQLLGDIRAEFGLTMLLITHDLGLARKLCLRAVVLKDGRMIESGATRTVFHHPQRHYTRQLVEASGVRE